MALLEQCNADVFAAILDIKSKYPENGEHLISILQKCEYLWQITLSEMLGFSAYLPWPIWDRKVHTFHLLFESQQTTKMP